MNVSGQVQSYLMGTAGLSVLLAVSVLLTAARPRLDRDTYTLGRASRLIALAVAAQALHFGEELATRFHERFPLLLKLEPWSARFFITFNVAWLLLWATSVVGLRRGVVWMLAPMWFLGLAMALNGVAHPLLAVRVGGYFPGLVTSPLVGVLGVGVLVCLFRITTLTPSAGRE